VADDVKIQVEFNPATVQAYRLVGYENRMLKREDFTDDSVDAGDLGAGQSVTALYEIVPVGASFSGRTVDSAKYTSTTVNKRFSGELLTVHVRHKKPGAKKSVQAERVVRVGDLRSFEQAGADTRFAVAVASFAQKLRKNTAVGNLSWDAVVTWAEQAAGKSDERREFVGLVRTAKLLEQTTGSAN
jgi:Ca-activated chloride channel family protein